MILTKEANLTVNPNNIIHLKNLGYENLKVNENIVIPIEHLSKGSGYKLEVKCDVCGKEKLLSYRRYMLSFNNGEYYACSNKCNFEKKRNKLHSKESFEKSKITLMKNYGVENSFLSNEIKKKSKETLLKNYGVENPMYSNKIKNKRIELFFEKYGVENPSQSDEIKNKKEQTSLKNNGVKYHLQNHEDYEKCFKKALKIKKYKDTKLNYQGSYELNFLEYCETNNILNQIKNYRVGIKYRINGRNRIYFPDFYIEKFNLIIEIKSTYTYNFHLEMNELKEKSCIDLGYKYLIIMDKNYKEFEENYASMFL